MPEFDLDAALTVPENHFEIQRGRWTLRLATGATDYPRVRDEPIMEAAWLIDYDGTTVGRGDFPFDSPAPTETFEGHCQAIWELGKVAFENVLNLDRTTPYLGTGQDFWDWVAALDLYA